MALLRSLPDVEVPAAGYAAARHSGDDLDEMRSLLERMEREEDGAVWVALDSLFHIAIARASANPVFGKVIEEIREALATQSAARAYDLLVASREPMAPARCCTAETAIVRSRSSGEPGRMSY